MEIDTYLWYDTQRFDSMFWFLLNLYNWNSGDKNGKETRKINDMIHRIGTEGKGPRLSEDIAGMDVH